MNNIIITGNIVRDINDPNLKMPAFGTSANGRTFYNNSIGFDSGYYDRTTNQWVSVPEFLEIKAFGPVADNLAKNYQKGDPVLLRGEMRAQRYVGQDGQNKTAYYIQVAGVERSSKKNPHAEGGNNAQNTQTASVQNTVAPTQGYARAPQGNVGAPVGNAPVGAQSVQTSAPDPYDGLPFV